MVGRNPANFGHCRVDRLAPPPPPPDSPALIAFGRRHRELSRPQPLPAQCGTFRRALPQCVPTFAPEKTCVVHCKCIEPRERQLYSQQSLAGRVPRVQPEGGR